MKNVLVMKDYYKMVLRWLKRPRHQQKMQKKKHKESILNAYSKWFHFNVLFIYLLCAFEFAKFWLFQEEFTP